MKKLLSLLGALGLTATGSAAVVACGDSDTTTNTDETLEGVTVKSGATLEGTTLTFTAPTEAVEVSAVLTIDNLPDNASITSENEAFSFEQNATEVTIKATAGDVAIEGDVVFAAPTTKADGDSTTAFEAITIHVVIPAIEADNGSDGDGDSEATDLATLDGELGVVADNKVATLLAAFNTKNSTNYAETDVTVNVTTPAVAEDSVTDADNPFDAVPGKGTIIAVDGSTIVANSVNITWTLPAVTTA